MYDVWIPFSQAVGESHSQGFRELVPWPGGEERLRKLRSECLDLVPLSERLTGFTAWALKGPQTKRPGVGWAGWLCG